MAVFLLNNKSRNTISNTHFMALVGGEELGLSALHDIEAYWLGRKRPCHRRVALAEP
jgi:hypothetical protein